MWQLFNRTIVVLLYGTHKIHDRAKQMCIEYDPAAQQYTVYEQAPDSGVNQTYARQRETAGKLFMAWTDDELESCGFPVPVVSHLRRIDSDHEFLDLEDELGLRFFEPAYNLIAYGHPDGEQPLAPRLLIEDDPADPEVTEEDREVERHLADDRKGAWFTRVEPEFLTEVMGRPIEDWMIFLHPDQRTAVERRYMGPARVRGAAGTGKTVVGLHRAAWLAERNRLIERNRRAELVPTDEDMRPILFTTFIRSLPPVFEALYLRLPGVRAGDVEFVNVDRLALRVCKDAGERLYVNYKKRDAAFSAAFEEIVTPGSPLAGSGFTRKYVRDEISVVIKGRAIGSLDTYLRIARTGRRVPMGSKLRTQVWELREAWDEEMAQRGVVDFADIILRALHHARRLDEPSTRP